MICAICGGLVLWEGFSGGAAYRKCKACGIVNGDVEPEGTRDCSNCGDVIEETEWEDCDGMCEDCFNKLNESED